MTACGILHFFQRWPLQDRAIPQALLTMWCWHPSSRGSLVSSLKPGWTFVTALTNRTWHKWFCVISEARLQIQSGFGLVLSASEHLLWAWLPSFKETQVASKSHVKGVFWLTTSNQQSASTARQASEWAFWWSPSWLSFSNRGPRHQYAERQDMPCLNSWPQ